MDDDREPRPDPLNFLPRSPRVSILQAHVDGGVFLPRWRQLFAFVDHEFVEVLEQADQKQSRLVQGVVLADTLDVYG
jgi:hypothetical protein